MKKLFCLILALGLMLRAMPAMADMSLYDMWVDYTYDEPDFIGKRRARSHDFGRYVEGSWVDTTSDYLLREYAQVKSGGTAEDLIVAWSLFDGGIALPFLGALAYDIDYVDASIERAESYSFYKGSTETGMVELYWLDIEMDSPYVEEDYSMIVCVSDSYGDVSVEYVVTSGDVRLLGYMSDKATSNYLGDMMVVNCNEWVSLRSMPDTSAERLKKVPLYATVNECYAMGNGFIFCEYNGVQGFILEEYLVQ